jgi:hypothetical protein
MIRDVDLVSYLPLYLDGYEENPATLEAENPEFILIWNATDRVLKNEFIETADEYGISRFEKILNIFPSKEDTLESRRARVQARWFSSIPYTFKAFVSKLAALCGDTDFTIIKDYEKYRIEIFTDLELFGQVDELEHIIETVMPCNMIVNSKNEMPCNVNGFALFGGGVVSMETFFITNDEKADVIVNGAALHGGGVVNTAKVLITNDFNEEFIANGGAFGAGVIMTDRIEVK